MGKVLMFPVAQFHTEKKWKWEVCTFGSSIIFLRFLGVCLIVGLLKIEMQSVRCGVTWSHCICMLPKGVN